ncbi:hypothetical protein PSBY109024_19580 [Pseudoalteromonas byunsanensis]
MARATQISCKELTTANAVRAFPLRKVNIVQKFNDKARSADIPFAQGELSCKRLAT